jgi:hypothetical protein
MRCKSESGKNALAVEGTGNAETLGRTQEWNSKAIERREL